MTYEFSNFLKKMNPHLTDGSIKKYGYDFKNLIAKMKNYDKVKKDSLNINKVKYLDVINIKTITILNKIKTVENLNKRKDLVNITVVLKKNILELLSKNDTNLINELGLQNKDYSSHGKDIEKFRKLLDTTNKKNQELGLELKKSKRERDNWVSTEDMDKLEILLKKKADSLYRRKKRNKEPFNINDIILFQEHLVIQLYNNRDFQQLRNDLCELEIFSNKEYIKQTDKYKNYLVLDTRNCFMVLNHDKTTKENKNKKYNIPKNICKYLRKFIKITTKPYLLVNNKLEQMSRNNFSKWFGRLTKKYIGKKVGTTILRHVHATEDENKNPTVKQRFKNAARLNHSIGQHYMYVRN